MKPSVISWQRGALSELQDAVRQLGLDPLEPSVVHVDPRPEMELRVPPANAPKALNERLRPGAFFEAHLEWSDGRRLLVLPDQEDSNSVRWAWHSCCTREADDE